MGILAQKAFECYLETKERIENGPSNSRSLRKNEIDKKHRFREAFWICLLNRSREAQAADLTLYTVANTLVDNRTY